MKQFKIVSIGQKVQSVHLTKDESVSFTVDCCILPDAHVSVNLISWNNGTLA